MNYLQLVNKVLVKLREPTVTTVAENAYSRLVGSFINDMKNRVEVAFDWNCLFDTVTITTTADLFSYALTGLQHNYRILNVVNDTGNVTCGFADVNVLTKRFLETPLTYGTPYLYGINGINANGDPLCDLWPVPDGVYSVRLNVVKHQPELAADLDTLSVPYEPVVQGAYAMALIERGEDGGMNSSEAMVIYASMLSDAVALEESRYPTKTDWVPV